MILKISMILKVSAYQDGKLLISITLFAPLFHPLSMAGMVIGPTPLSGALSLSIIKLGWLEDRFEPHKLRGYTYRNDLGWE